MVIRPVHVPEYKLRLFTTFYGPSSSTGNQISSTQPPVNRGWLCLTGEHVPIKKYNIRDTVREKSTFDFTINGDYSWYLGVDMVCKQDDTFYYPKTDAVDETFVQPVPTGSRLFISFYTNEGGNGVGTVTIDGTDVDDNTISETVNINGDGSYLTSKTFKTVTTVSDDSVSGLLSVWANVGLHENRREIQLYVDGNNDGVYGLLFGGYMEIPRRNPTYGNDNVNVVCYCHTDFSMANENLTAYRAPYKCSRYSILGTTAVCSSTEAVSAGVFGGLCKIGDAGVRSPNGDYPRKLDGTIDETKTCLWYQADTSKPLMFDGYTYRKDYAEEGTSGYSYYPEDYTRVIHALTKAHRSVDDMNRSTEWRPICVATFKLDQDITDSLTGIVNIRECYGKELSNGDYVAIEYTENNSTYVEYIKVSGTSTANSYGGSGVMTIDARGCLMSAAKAHSSGAQVYAYEISQASVALTSDTDWFLVEGDHSSTLYASGRKHSETMGLFMETRETVFWIDYYRNLHMHPMYSSSPARSGDFILSEHDVLKVEGLSMSDVYNHVHCYVETPADGDIFCEMSALEVPGYESSIDIFGRRSYELDSTHINVVGESDIPNGYRGFVPSATNFLKVNAFPIIKQTVTLEGFYPSEMYWRDAVNPHTALDWTDPVNKYIDVKGKLVKCIDYNFESRPEKVWTVEAMNYIGELWGDATVKMTMSRLSVPADFLGA